ncbi:hypothetical protein [Microcystis phage Mwe-JY26]
MQEIWAVQQNADFAEGRGPMIPKWLFTHFDVARDFVEIAIARGPYGEDLRIGDSLATQQHWYRIKSMRLFSSIDQTEEYKKKMEKAAQEAIRAKALAKLTPEERAALGYT